MKVAVCQTRPVLLDRDATIARVCEQIEEAAQQGAKLCAFAETLIPAYPIWLSRLNGAAFDHPTQKAWHARYLEQAVDIERGDLDAVRDAARTHAITVVVGIAERPADRGGHSIFASAVTIAPTGDVLASHRKLMPTYEERLAWTPGDAHGLKAHTIESLAPFTLGALNCWENWMPLPRAALWAQGVDLHVSIWPGRDDNTSDNCRFVAREGRSFVLGVSSWLEADDLNACEDLPEFDRLQEALRSEGASPIHNGGSCIAAPDGTWVLPPQTQGPGVFSVDIHHNYVLEERQSFDAAGHYARPELLALHVNNDRSSGLSMSQQKS